LDAIQQGGSNLDAIEQFVRRNQFADAAFMLYIARIEKQKNLLHLHLHLHLNLLHLL
jgi:hypothetical protein